MFIIIIIIVYFGVGDLMLIDVFGRFGVRKKKKRNIVVCVLFRVYKVVP